MVEKKVINPKKEQNTTTNDKLKEFLFFAKSHQKGLQPFRRRNRSTVFSEQNSRCNFNMVLSTVLNAR